MKTIYIVLSQTGTLFSKAIRRYTKDPYNHASLSFCPGLTTMYSFGRRQRYNVLNAGFIQESFDRGIFAFFPDTYFCVLEVPVTDAEYTKMRRLVEAFNDDWQKYRYNLIGVLSYSMGIGLSRKDHYFCSQFVSYVLSHTAFWNRSPELTKPMDFFSIPRKRIIFQGNIIGYQRAVAGGSFNPVSMLQ